MWFSVNQTAYSHQQNCDYVDTAHQHSCPSWKSPWHVMLQDPVNETWNNGWHEFCGQAVAIDQWTAFHPGRRWGCNVINYDKCSHCSRYWCGLFCTCPMYSPQNIKWLSSNLQFREEGLEKPCFVHVQWIVMLNLCGGGVSNAINQSNRFWRVLCSLWCSWNPSSTVIPWLTMFVSFLIKIQNCWWIGVSEWQPCNPMFNA